MELAKVWITSNVDVLRNSGLVDLASVRSSGTNECHRFLKFPKFRTGGISEGQGWWK